MKKIKKQKQFDISSEDVKSLSEFVENGDNDVSGFTVTLKGGAIRNFFINCQLPADYEKLKKLKSYYRELKK